MRRSLLLLALTSALGLQAEPVVKDSSFSEHPQGWSIWSPRDEIAPKGWADRRTDRGDGGSLALSGISNPGVFGGWTRTADVQPGSWYQLAAYYRTEGLSGLSPRQAVLVRLDWETAEGKRAGRPEYAFETADDNGWTRVSVAAAAPDNAAAAKIELFLVNAPQTTVWFDDVSLDKIAAPQSRQAKIASVNLRPSSSTTPGSAKQNLEAFAAVIAKEVDADADLIVLPEGATVVRTGLSYEEVAEPVPGPSTKQLGEIARSKNAYVVAGIYEREGSTLYNTAVLVDRQGEYVGKYRKVYLPREEFEAGLTPGSDFPVFETDFGKLGIMICWDVQYADPARALALRGAEVIAMPIWGGNMTLARARAVENHVVLVSSGYDHPTYVMDPQGEILSQADEEGTVAQSIVDLNKRYHWDWLGEMRGRYFHELRRDVDTIPVDLR